MALLDMIKKLFGGGKEEPTSENPETTVNETPSEEVTPEETVEEVKEY